MRFSSRLTLLSSMLFAPFVCAQAAPADLRPSVAGACGAASRATGLDASSCKFKGVERRHIAADVFE